MNPHKQGVYVILNSTNGKVYVGSSEDIPNRRTRHFRELRRGTHRNCHLQAAFTLHGELVFEFIVLESVEDAFWLRPRECAWIKKLQAVDRDFGYNITEDAWSSLSNLYRSEERKARFLAAQRSEITKKRRSLATAKWQKARPLKHTQEWKDAQSKRSQLWFSDPANRNAIIARNAKIGLSKQANKPLIKKVCPQCSDVFEVRFKDRDRVCCNKNCALAYRWADPKQRTILKNRNHRIKAAGANS